jgi:acetyl-CoA carboxylase carboxyl transferase subunit beta
MTANASGGARMHEGVFSLMQMGKTVAAFKRLGRARLPHFSLLVDPCYGGVTASYATVADVIMAEPGALIGFAGQRVIEQVTKQKLPEGFQTAEFFFEHGMLDVIVQRENLASTVVTLIDHYQRLRGIEPTVEDSSAANGVLPAEEATQVVTGKDSVR